MDPWKYKIYFSCWTGSLTRLLYLLVRYPGIPNYFAQFVRFAIWRDLLFDRVIGQRKVNITNYLPIITNINYNIQHGGRKARKARARTFCLVKQRRSSDWFTVVRRHLFLTCLCYSIQDKIIDRIEHNWLSHWLHYKLNHTHKQQQFINKSRHNGLFVNWNVLQNSSRHHSRYFLDLSCDFSVSSNSSLIAIDASIACMSRMLRRW